MALTTSDCAPSRGGVMMSKSNEKPETELSTVLTRLKRCDSNSPSLSPFSYEHTTACKPSRLMIAAPTRRTNH